MSSNTQPFIVIGGGFCGTLAAIHLSRRLPGELVILIEENGNAGPGLAYQAADPSCPLNVPAGNMSAFPDEPDHFLNYARWSLGEGVMPDDFLPRRIYGAYLTKCFADEMARNRRLTVEHRSVVDVAASDGPRPARVIFKDQSHLDAAKVILATGNQGSAFSSSIWAQHTLPARDPASLHQVEPGQNVLIVGSGLTMIDAVLELDRRGNAAVIHAISRNGLLPQPYAPPSGLALPDLDHLPDSDLRRSVRLFRQAIRDHEAKGGNWRDLFAALRPSTPSLWKELSPRQRAKFLRFLSPFWEIHRHQCPPETRERVENLIASGKLVLHRGTIVSVERACTGLCMGLAARTRGEADRWLAVDHIFDATGPARDLETIRQPLIQNLLRRGFLKPDIHRLGAETSADYRAIGRGGQPSDWLFVVGPMLRARYYEATAVSELRLHAAALASRVESAHRGNLADKPVAV